VDLKLSHRYTDGIAIIDIEGEVDIHTSSQLRELLLSLIRKGYYQLVVDLDKIAFLDSTGLGVLVGSLKRVREHDGSISLACTQERILKIFRITGLMSVFGIYSSVDEALDAAAVQDPA
jgi:anti-sigma B factor antagonist